MSALIDQLIPRQNFELILDRIGEILTVEFENQVLLGNYDLDDIRIFKERSVPFGQAESPIVNVSVFTGEYMEETQAQAQGYYRFLVEVIANAKSTTVTEDNDGRGDRIAALKMMRLLGIIRAILMDARYKTLGFAAPSLGHRKVERIYFMNPPHQDADTTRQGRLDLLVKIPETPASFVTPVPLAQQLSNVTLHETEFGYEWIYYG